MVGAPRSSSKRRPTPKLVSVSQGVGGGPGFHWWRPYTVHLPGAVRVQFPHPQLGQVLWPTCSSILGSSPRSFQHEPKPHGPQRWAGKGVLRTFRTYLFSAPWLYSRTSKLGKRCENSAGLGGSLKPPADVATVGQLQMDGVPLPHWKSTFMKLIF